MSPLTKKEKETTSHQKKKKKGSPYKIKKKIFLFFFSLVFPPFITMDSKSAPGSPAFDAETIPSSSQTQFEAYAPAEPPNLWKVFKQQVTTKEGWWGEYDWKTMCFPTIFLKDKTKAPFWGLNSKLPLGLAIVMGFQHSLAMVTRHTL